MSYRPDFWPIGDGKGMIGGPLSFLYMCEYVHADTTGSGDCPPEKVDNAIKCLEWIRAHWRQPSTIWERHALELVKATIAEAKLKAAKGKK